MKILMIHDKYNWNSYSIVRSACEILKEREDVEYLEIGSEKYNEMGAGDYVWVFSSAFSLLDIEYKALKEKGVKVVAFGLSDPSRFDESRLDTCDVYCTNDVNTAWKYDAYHFPYAVDLKRFRRVDAAPYIDVLFIGTLQHPFIPYRKPYLLKLRKEAWKFEGYGHGFDRFLEGEELIEKYNQAHLVIDVCTKYSSIASRIFQAAACGVPSLTLKRDDILQCFEDGKEILTYEGGYFEMKLAITEALRDKERLAKIGENARQRCLKEHGMRKRIDDLINYLGGLYGSMARKS